MIISTLFVLSVAVEVACREMGIAEDDPRPFTVTGGLPYFGGAGNAYTLMSVATMMDKLRANPGKWHVHGQWLV